MAAACPAGGAGFVRFRGNKVTRQHRCNADDCDELPNDTDKNDFDPTLLMIHKLGSPCCNRTACSSKANLKTPPRQKNGLIVSANSDSRTCGVTDASTVVNARRVPIQFGRRKSS